MGMFDSVFCEKELPEIGVRPDIEFQTKDMDCVLNTYTIHTDGTLTESIHGDVNLCDYTGLMQFYTYIRKKENLKWFTYVALFHHGRMVGDFFHVPEGLRIPWHEGYDYVKAMRYFTYTNTRFPHPDMPIGAAYRVVLLDVRIGDEKYAIIQDVNNWRTYGVTSAQLREFFTPDTRVSGNTSENESSHLAFTDWLQRCHGDFLSE